MEKCWKDVRVGDFVQLQCNEIIPADILLLYSSDQKGICHLETANLDGETNLKQRQVVMGFSSQVSLKCSPWAVCLQLWPLCPSKATTLRDLFLHGSWKEAHGPLPKHPQVSLWILCLRCGRHTTLTSQTGGGVVAQLGAALRHTGWEKIKEWNPV